MFTMGCQKYKYNQIRLKGWLSMVGELSHKKSKFGPWDHIWDPPKGLKLKILKK